MPKVHQVEVVSPNAMRFDLLILRLGEHFCRVTLGAPAAAWDAAIRPVLEAKLQELDLARPVEAMELARKIGILRKNPGRRRLKR